MSLASFPFMRPFPYVIILAALFFCTTTLLAQQHDTRLSFELPEPVLPAAARIQDAATIGGRTLVVWGSTADDGAGETRNVLWMQFVEHGSPVGMPAPFTGADAAPAWLLRIDTASGSFFIFWNDERSGAPQGYMRRVDTAGTMGAEHLLESAGFVPPGPFAYGTTSGPLLLWNNALHLMATSCDSLGIPLGSPYILADGPISGLDHLTNNPPRAVIDRGPYPPLLLDERGRPLWPNIPPAAFSRPYHITADGTVVMIQDSILSYYHSLLDSIPYRTVIVNLPDDRFHGSEFVSADSTGHMVVGYGGLHRVIYGGSTDYDISMWLQTEITDSTFDSPMENIVGFWRSFHHCYEYGYRILDVKRIRTCKDHYDIITPIHVSAVWSCTSLPGHDFSSYDTLRIVGTGVYTRGSYATPAPCPAQAPGRVARLVDGYESRVEVSLPEGRIRLGAPVAKSLRNVPQLYPAFTASNGLLGLAWLSAGQHVVAPLVRWDIAAGGTHDRIAELPIDSIVPGIDVSRFQSRPIISPSGNGFLLTTKRTWSATDSAKRAIDSSEFCFYLPVGMEWRLVRTITIAGGLDRLRPLRFASVPDQPYDLIGYQWVTADGVRGRVAVDAVDTDGRIAWSIDTLVTSADDPYLVPIGSRELLLLQGDQYRYFDGDSLHPALAFSGLSNPFYAPMLGSRFLRWSAYHSVDFALYDRDGKAPHGGNDKMLPYDSPEFTIVQNPADSGFALVYGGKGGVHMIVVDKNMNIVEQDAIVSETHDSVGHPVAIYLNDTLHVAWEDYRNGVADIYGRAIPFNMRLGVPWSANSYRSRQSNAIASIEPNPASGASTIRLRSTPPPGSILDVVNVHGTTVISWTIEYGSDAIEIDASALPSGSYLVILHDDTIRGSARLVVVR